MEMLLADSASLRGPHDAHVTVGPGKFKQDSDHDACSGLTDCSGSDIGRPFQSSALFLPTKKPLNLSIQGLDLLLSGSTTWTRTRDPVINSHLLYQLSYRGMTRMLLIGKEKSS